MTPPYFLVCSLFKENGKPPANAATAFGGEFQPGLYKGVENRKFANPAPLGLSAFALTTFVLSLINVGARDLTEPNIVVALAFGYGGLVQLLAGMWYVGFFLVKTLWTLTNIGKWLSAILLVLLPFPHMVASGWLSLSSLLPVASKSLPPLKRLTMELQLLSTTHSHSSSG